MDQSCHRIFGSPTGQLRMPDGRWVVMIRLQSFQSLPTVGWLESFAAEVGWAWTEREGGVAAPTEIGG